MRSQFQKLKESKEGMQKIYKQIEQQMLSRGGPGVLSFNELNNYYTVIKEESLREQNMTEEEY